MNARKKRLIEVWAPLVVALVALLLSISEARRGRDSVPTKSSLPTVRVVRRRTAYWRWFSVANQKAELRRVAAAEPRDAGYDNVR
jgi:hypothetical protein